VPFLLFNISFFRVKQKKDVKGQTPASINSQREKIGLQKRQSRSLLYGLFFGGKEKMPNLFDQLALSLKLFPLPK
jgi:hypothetical protein